MSSRGMSWADAVAGLTKALASGSNPKDSLELKTVGVGLHRCWHNAEALLVDARLLASGGRLRRSLALAILGLEELAKVPDLFDTYLRVATNRQEGSPADEEWAKFWARFVRHSAKQSSTERYGRQGMAVAKQRLSMDDVKYPILYLFGEMSLAGLDVIKQRCFYVDFVDHEFVSWPDDDLRLSELLDCLLVAGEERLDVFAALHSTESRSQRSLSLTVDFFNKAREGVSSGELVEHFQSLNMSLSDSLHLDETIGVIRTLLASSVTKAVPDYLNVSLYLNDLAAAWGEGHIVSAVRNVGRALRDRFDPTGLARSYERSFSKFKLVVNWLKEIDERDTMAELLRRG